MKKKLMIIFAAIIVLGIIGSFAEEEPEDSETQTKGFNQSEVEEEDDTEDLRTEESVEITEFPVATQKTTLELTYDFEKDVECGLLYSSERGWITDKDGNVIPEYGYLRVLDGYLCDTIGEHVMDGYFVGDGGKIITREMDIVQELPTPTPAPQQQYKRISDVDFFYGLYRDENMFNNMNLEIFGRFTKINGAYIMSNEYGKDLVQINLDGNMYDSAGNIISTEGVEKGYMIVYGRYVGIDTYGDKTVNATDIRIISSYDYENLTAQTDTEELLESESWYEINALEYMKKPSAFSGKKLKIYGKFYKSEENDWNFEMKSEDGQRRILITFYANQAYHKVFDSDGNYLKEWQKLQEGYMVVYGEQVVDSYSLKEGIGVKAIFILTEEQYNELLN